jgi:hypothetical protein
MEVDEFFRLLEALEEPLHEHTKVTKLTFVTQLTAIKSKFFFLNNCYNELLKLIGDVLLNPNKLPKGMYHLKKLVKGLGMDYEKIDVCRNSYMFFWKEHKEENKCLKCGKSRYVKVINDDGEMVTIEVAHKQLHYIPIAPRLKRMFLSERIMIHMRWHKDGERDNKEVMVHPSYSDTWKALDNFDLEFSRDTRNVRIGLAIEGFILFGDNASSYSCWPVFVVPYNLLPSLCMKYEFMFLCLDVPGPDHPRPKIIVMLKPLIDELKELWNGVEAYDYHKKQKFTLWAAYLWLIHDFIPYGIFVGWSIHGRWTHMICRFDTYCFRLTTGGKISYFDYHLRWLPPKHPFRMQKDSFRKDTVIKKGPPKRLSRPETTKNLSKLVLNREVNGYEGYEEEHN